MVLCNCGEETHLSFLFALKRADNEATHFLITLIETKFLIL